MNHYLICQNPGCRFVLDNRLNGRGAAPRRFLLSSCPQCGGGWASNRPLPRRALGPEWDGKLPFCACCSGNGHARRKAA
jgi:hypothetical protein